MGLLELDRNLPMTLVPDDDGAGQLVVPPLLLRIERNSQQAEAKGYGAEEVA